MVDVPRIESGQYHPGDPLTCRWKRRGRSARVLRAYRRHWYGDHWVPFEVETKALVQSLGALSARPL